MPNRKNRINRLKSKAKTLAPVEPPKKISGWQKIKKTSILIYGILVVIATMLGWYFLKDNFRKEFASEHTKWKEEKFIKGIFIPNDALDFKEKMHIQYGQIVVSYNMSKFRDGIEIKQIFDCDSESNPIKIRLTIENNRLNVTAKFKDIQKEELVGEIANNKWTLFKDNLLDYHDDDSTLEVLDRGANVIFSLRFERPHTIRLRGYFVGNSNVAIISDNAFMPCNDLNESSNRKRIMEFIDEIKRLCNYE